MSEWISVKDKLSNLNELVLVWDFFKRRPYVDKLVEYCRPFGVSVIWHDYENKSDPQQKNITHWLPIPKDPNSEDVCEKE